MADLAFHQSLELSFSNSGNYTPTAFDTTGDTWACLTVHDFTASGQCSNITAVTYNGVSITAKGHVNGAVTGIIAGRMAVYPFSLGANAGNHSFNIQWTGGQFLDFQAISGNGDLDTTNIIDGTPVDSSVVSGTPTAGKIIPTPYTTTTDKALPVFACMSDSQGNTMGAGVNCTLAIKSALDGGVATYYAAIKTPAGATNEQFTYSHDTENCLTISFAFKPTGAAGGTNWGPMLGQQLNRIVQA